MKAALQGAIERAFQQAAHATREARSADAFQWLERAHILTQRRSLLHAKSHWLTLALGWRIGDYREVVGQILRIFAALLLSKIWVPTGNTGRARVSTFAPMQRSDELQRLVQEGKPQ